MNVLIFYLLFLLGGCTSTTLIKVLKTTKNLSTFTGTSGAELISSSHADYEAATVCARFLSYQFHPFYQILIQFGHVNFGLFTMRELRERVWDEVITEWQDGNTTGFIWTSMLKTFPIWNLNVWNHVCISGRFKDSHILAVMNGEIVFEDDEYEEMDEEKKSNIIFMGDYEGKDKGFKSSFFGEITDIHTWDRALTVNEMKGWTQCRLMITGNIVDWTTAKWNSVELEEVEINKEDLCEENKSDSNIILAERRLNFNDTINFCESSLGGKIAVATDKNTLENMKKVFRNAGKDTCASHFFTGSTDREVEGHFVNVHTGEAMKEVDWEKGEPNNWGTGEDCSTYDVDRGTVNDISCDIEYCPICLLEPYAKFELSGACMDSGVDSFYIMQSGEELLGYKHSKMSWSDKERRWEIISLLNYTTLAFSSDTTSFPLGMHHWVFLASNCTDPGEQGRRLNLHRAVDQPGNFCCDDGLCISSEMRCDINKNCEDYSDEKDCDLILLPEYDYHKNMPPIPKKSKFGGNIPKAEIITNITILDILDVNMEVSYINVIFRLTLKWNDNRIRFNFLKHRERQNLINSYDNIWKPDVNFLILEDQKYQDKLYTKITVKRMGEPSISPRMDSVQYNETYEGKDNPIIMRNLYQSKFICDFETIKFYPFDEQTCRMKFYIAGSGEDLAILIKKELKVFAPTTVDEHVIRMWDMSEGNVTKEGSAGLIISINLGRNMFSIIMVTYLPTLLMNIINQATTYVNSEDNYDVIITVNITSMMVLASIYLSVSSSLPTTSSIKPVEIWLLFNLFYPFMVIIINILLKVID